MATANATWVVDYQNSTNATFSGSLAQNATTAALQLGKRRLVFISGHTSNSNIVCSLNFTLGNSAGTVAPAPTSSSPFVVVSSEGVVVDLGDSYDQIRLGNFNNATNVVQYSILVLSKH